MTTIRLELVSLLVCCFPGLWLGESFSPVKGNYVALILIPDEIRRQEVVSNLSGHPFSFLLFCFRVFVHPFLLSLYLFTLFFVLCEYPFVQRLCVVCSYLGGISPVIAWGSY